MLSSVVIIMHYYFQAMTAVAAGLWSQNAYTQTPRIP